MIILWMFLLFQSPEGPVTPYLEKDVPLKDFNAKDATIAELFHGISKEMKINIVVDPALQDRVSLRIYDSTLNELLTYFVTTFGVRCEVIGGIIHLGPPEPEELDLVNDILWDKESGQLGFDLTTMTLREFAKKVTQTTEYNLVVLDKTLKGNVTGFQGALPFEKGLQAFLQSNGFDLVADDGFWHIQKWVPQQELASQSEPGEPALAKAENEKGGSAQPQAKPVSASGEPIEIHDDLVDIHVDEMPLMDVFDRLSKLEAFEFVLYGELEGTISADVNNLSYNDLLDLLLNNTPFTYILEDGKFLIGDKTSTLFLTSASITLNHMNAEMMTQILPASLTEGITVTMVKEHNSLLLTGPRNRVNQVKALAESMDLNIPQVLIEVLVVDFSTNEDRDMGVTITNGENQYFPELDLTLDGFRGEDGGFSIRRLPSNFSLRIRAMEENGRAKIISKPHIAALNGHEAEIVIGTKQFYILETEELVGNENPRVRTTQEIKEIEANINLKITPWVSGQGEVTTLIEPSFTTFLGNVTNSVPPPISTRKLKSTVRLKDGETIILGGLIENFSTQDYAGVPFISRIPILGSLFRNSKNSERNSELVIYLTPHVYYGTEGSIEFIQEAEGLDYQLDVSKQKQGIKGDYPKKKSWWQKRKERRAAKKKETNSE